MTDDTARRERAEKWFDTNEVPTQDDDDWASNHTAHEIGWAQLIGYLAGAREEAAIHEKKIQNLRDLVKSQEQDIDRMYAEIERGPLFGRGCKVKTLACSLVLALFLCSGVSGVAPITPVSYSWIIRPAPNPPWVTFRFDTCTTILRATETTSAYVVLYYFPPPFGSATGAQGLEMRVQFPANTNVPVGRKVPYNIPCPCLVCIIQDCPNGTTHTQCGYVLRPGEELPPGWWTPFSQLAQLPVCPAPPNYIFSDGFESGDFRKWVVR